MAGVAVTGCILFAVAALNEGRFDWHRYTSVVGFIVLACAASWGLSALAAIAFQTSRRRSWRQTSSKRPGPWDRHGTMVSRTDRLKRGAERRGIPGVLILTAAFASGFGGFALFYVLTAGDVGSIRTNIVLKTAEIMRFGSRNDNRTAEKSAAQQAAGGIYALCRSTAQRSCVIDGDTIRHDGIRIRIADIDTPEISAPKCASEAALGHRAKERLLELLSNGSFDIVHPGGRDEDVYGRKLRVLMRDGRSLGLILIEEGLARRWTGSRRSWCM